jgi:hypothetical protein
LLCFDRCKIFWPSGIKAKNSKLKKHLHSHIQPASIPPHKQKKVNVRDQAFEDKILWLFLF